MESHTQSVSFNNIPIVNGMVIYQMGFNQSAIPIVIESTVVMPIDNKHIVVSRNGVNRIVEAKGVHTDKLELLTIWINDTMNAVRTKLPQQLRSLINEFAASGGIVTDEMKMFVADNNSEI